MRWGAWWNKGVFCTFLQSGLVLHSPRLPCDGHFWRLVEACIIKEEKERFQLLDHPNCLYGVPSDMPQFVYIWWIAGRSPRVNSLIVGCRFHVVAHSHPHLKLDRVDSCCATSLSNWSHCWLQLSDLIHLWNVDSLQKWRTAQVYYDIQGSLSIWNESYVNCTIVVRQADSVHRIPLCSEKSKGCCELVLLGYQIDKYMNWSHLKHSGLHLNRI